MLLRRVACGAAAVAIAAYVLTHGAVAPQPSEAASDALWAQPPLALASEAAPPPGIYTRRSGISRCQRGSNL